MIFNNPFREFFLALFGGLGQGGVINILPVKPFETVMVIKGYTNKIEFNWNLMNSLHSPWSLGKRWTVCPLLDLFLCDEVHRGTQQWGERNRVARTPGSGRRTPSGSFETSEVNQANWRHSKNTREPRTNRAASLRHPGTVPCAVVFSAVSLSTRRRRRRSPPRSRDTLTERPPSTGLWREPQIRMTFFTIDYRIMNVHGIFWLQYKSSIYCMLYIVKSTVYRAVTVSVSGESRHLGFGF